MIMATADEQPQEGKELTLMISCAKTPPTMAQAGLSSDMQWLQKRKQFLFYTSNTYSYASLYLR